MKVEVIPDSFATKQYNEKATHPMQSWEWGEAKKKLGIEVLRIGEFEDNKLRDVFQITFHSIPKTPFKVGYLPRSGMPKKQTLDFLKDYGNKHKIIFVKLEPNIEKGQHKIDSELKYSSHPMFAVWTQMLDMAPSEEELFKNLKSKTRYNIRLAEKKGVYIKEQSDEEGFKIFSKLYFETCKRQHYHGHDMKYHKTVWQEMKKIGAHILIAYFEKTPLAAYELFVFNNVLYYPYGGSSDQHRNLMGANLLMWESIKLGKKQGANLYDMWGSLPQQYDPKDLWAGFTRFKEGYNTRFVEMLGSYDLIVNPLMYSVYNVVYKLRSILLKHF